MSNKNKNLTRPKKTINLIVFVVLCFLIPMPVFAQSVDNSVCATVGIEINPDMTTRTNYSPRLIP